MTTKPIIPWMGGKRRLAKHILPTFPEHTCYVEPFAGGAALLFMKEPSKAEVINDINGELVNLYRVVSQHLEEFVKQFRWALVSREMFEWSKITEPETLTDIQRAARFFYLQKLAFGAKVHGQTFGTDATRSVRLNLLRIEEDLSQAHIRLSRVCIERLDWLKCMLKYDREHTLFYCDPPYWQVAGYGTVFGIEEYQQMAEMMHNAKGKVIVSVNDHPDMRNVFAGLNMQTLTTSYTVGGKPKKADELLIRNF